MTATQVAAPSWRASGSPRAAAWVHYLSLLLGACALLFLARNQWFFFDEWDIIWQPEAAKRFVEGHNGHWSALPIGVWTFLQNTFGLGSYLPYVGVAIAAHLVVAHLLWRVLTHAGSTPWIATALAAVFVFYGAAGENLLWAFQMGFMGAIAFGLGALLVVVRPTMRTGGLIATIALLTAGAATAGTVLPFFVAVALVAWYRHGWVKALVAVGVPALVYLFWYTIVAGPNPTAIFRAQGLGQILAGIPEFVGTMFVGAYNASTPVPGFGIVVVTAIAVWGVVTAARARLTVATVVALSMLAAGLVFGVLTGYSRAKLGAGSADESRYIYIAAVFTLPAIALILSRIARRAVASTIAVVALIGVVFVYNAGLLVLRAGGDSARELGTHDVLSAALDLADEHPGEVDPDARPDPVYLPRTISQLQELEADFGMRRSDYGEDARLTALTTVGLNTSASAGGPATCEIFLQEGSTISAGPEGIDLEASTGASVTLFAQDGEARGLSQTVALDPGRTTLTMLEPTELVVEKTTAPVALCEEVNTP
ncbi:hypothetical protein [Microbacterium hibisci]|uniref:hypothetical protein n=1 Tax=Microbacterium hibisci TaxID=2036000 RepID=UPI001943AEDD|nr:hypothetical protein [Microbacterium hibisci]